MKQSEKNKIEATTRLAYLLPVGSTVYCLCRHVSASGMSRKISFFTDTSEGLQNITYYVAHLLEYKLTEYQSDRVINVTGCGMDMGFHVVYQIGKELFREGFIPADAGHTFGRNGASNTDLDTDGGYALNHKQI